MFNPESKRLHSRARTGGHRVLQFRSEDYVKSVTFLAYYVSFIVVSHIDVATYR